MIKSALMKPSVCATATEPNLLLQSPPTKEDLARSGGSNTPSSDSVDTPRPDSINLKLHKGASIVSAGAIELIQFSESIKSSESSKLKEEVAEASDQDKRPEFMKFLVDVLEWRQEKVDALA